MVDKNDFKQLLTQLLPTGDPWTVEPNSELDEILEGIAKHFKVVDDRISELKESSFIDSPTTIWRGRYPRYFTSRNYPLNLSTESIRFQLELEGYKNFKFWSGDPIDNPFELYFKGATQQEGFKEAVLECVPAHVKVTFILEKGDGANGKNN